VHAKFTHTVTQRFDIAKIALGDSLNSRRNSRHGTIVVELRQLSSKNLATGAIDILLKFVHSVPPTIM